MNWLVRALSSSIGKKFVMGITGLLLCGFLVVHLAGNLLLYVGVDAYNEYAHAVHSQPALLAVAEIALLLLFLAHLLLAVVTTWENRQARGREDYAVKASKQKGFAPFFPHNWMWITGVIVLGFILLHLADFTFELRNRGSADEVPFDKAVRLMKDPITIVGYLVGVIFLGIHLAHGFASAFQSLGINHPKYNKLIFVFGGLFAAVIAVGFATFPIWAMFK